MEKEKAGVNNTDGENMDQEMDTMGPVEGRETDKKDNHIKVNVKTDAKPENGAPDDQEAESIEQLKGNLAAVKKEKNETNDRLLRTAAEFDNYKKRQDKQWNDFKKYANESLAKDLLTVVDNLERAIAAAQETRERDSLLIEGVKMTLDEILKILKRYSVTPIESKGNKFDPNFHQAVCTQPVEDAESNIVLEEYQKGYLIHDRLLRPAMVVVSAAAQSGKAAEQENK